MIGDDVTTGTCRILRHIKLTLPTMTGQIISPSAATTTIADVTDAAHTRQIECPLKPELICL